MRQHGEKIGLLASALVQLPEFRSRMDHSSTTAS
jgi:hypothetical protein